MTFLELLLTATWLSGVVVSLSTTGSPVVPPGSPMNNSKIVIAVGKGSFSFIPNTVTAKPGDEIIFEFWSTGHSVARSAFGFPCMPYEYIMPEATGFWSGDVVDVTPSSHPTFSITVNDTQPTFFYCALASSCKANRMIGVINPNSTWTLAQQDYFINPSIVELQPGDPLPSESNRTESPPTDSQDSDDDMPSLSVGEIAGVAISSLALMILITALAYTCIRQSRIEKRRRRKARDHPNSLPLINTSGISDSALRSPPPLQNGSNFVSPVSGHPENSGHWSMNSALTTPRRNSFRLCLPAVINNVPSETSLVYCPEQQRSEMPGSLVPVELPAANECRITKSS
ncbi:hypothetical protein F5B22DRAFT_191966 [Xylaria bambusicola]|uniref:uncharacterized protein n=1 Tax=Xylaria bambusicola TaxID=326684 RepID=UPI002007C045|nr:uncharacterized protein F5B22DRAFT_191966 [Xylaria bambusicola]KAI0515189.1 hypothetical protein F5B22DRAFT_191966 [Xylaria bambusicola]